MSEPIPPVRVHGHRGARARLPENTIAGFEYAIRQGVDALEMDLAVTKDDTVVISHDPILHRPICTGPRVNATFAMELRVAVLSFDFRTLRAVRRLASR